MSRFTFLGYPYTDLSKFCSQVLPSPSSKSYSSHRTRCRPNYYLSPPLPHFFVCAGPAVPPQLLPVHARLPRPDQPARGRVCGPPLLLRLRLHQRPAQVPGELVWSRRLSVAKDGKDLLKSSGPTSPIASCWWCGRQARRCVCMQACPKHWTPVQLLHTMSFTPIHSVSLQSSTHRPTLCHGVPICRRPWSASASATTAWPSRAGCAALR